MARPVYGRFPFLTCHPVAPPPVYPFHSLGWILGRYITEILLVAAAGHFVFTSMCAVALPGGAGPAESLVQ